MGYVEDLKDKEVENFAQKIAEKKAEENSNILFELDLSIVSFSCKFKEGFDLLKNINKLIKAIKKWKKGVDKSIEEMYKDIKKKISLDKSIEKDKRKQLLKEMKKICKEATKEEEEKIGKLKKIRNNLRLRLFNFWIYIITAALAFGYGAILYQNNNIANIIVYPIYGLTILGFIALQVTYTLKYLKAIKADRSGTISYCVKRAYSTLLVVWWYLTLLVIINDWSVKISTYTFAATFIFYIVFMVYDLFLSSSFFDEIESSVSLIAAIIIGIVSFTDVIESKHYISQIAGISMLCACFLLTIIILKKFLIDKPNIGNILEVLYVAMITVVTIGLTIASIYKIFWIEPIEGQVVENTLFSAIIEVYAAMLGGGITLVGVAWTIKDANIKRQKELERIENERKEEERKKYRPFVNVYAGHNLQGLNITSDIMVTKWLNNTEDISNKPTERLMVANNIRNCWFGNTDFCSFYVWGIKINSNMTNFDSIRYIKKEFYFPLNFTGPIYTEKPIENLSLILEDMLGNLYELKLAFSVNSAIQQIVVSGNEPTIFIGEKKTGKTDE